MSVDQCTYSYLLGVVNDLKVALTGRGDRNDEDTRMEHVEHNSRNEEHLGIMFRCLKFDAYMCSFQSCQRAV